MSHPHFMLLHSGPKISNNNKMSQEVVDIICFDPDFGMNVQQ